VRSGGPFAPLALRARGSYFLMITFALSQVVWSVAFGWRTLTNGDDGMPDVVRPNFGFSLDNTASFYYFTLAVVGVATVVLVAIVRSPFGRALRGIRESESRMQALGFDVWRYQYVAFVLSAAFAGVAGALYAYYNRFVGPEYLYVIQSAEALIMVILGGAGTLIGANAVIGPDVQIGQNCAIGSGSSITNTIIGDRVVIHPGCHIGQDGFGFSADADGFVKVPQLGRVVIGDDVEIGANATIDRGAGPDTVIGAGSMIDNLVQIGHNVQLGRNCILVAQSGISGSTRLGDFVMIGGQAGLVGHLEIGAGARIGAKAGVPNDVAAGETVLGSPAVPIRLHHRQAAALKRLATKKGA